MGGTAKPVNPQIDEPSDDSSSKDSIESTLNWLIKSGPRWARIPALLVTATITLSSPIVAARNWLFPPVKPETQVASSDPVAGQLDMTSTAKASVDFVAMSTVISRPEATEDERAKAKVALASTTHRLNHLSNPEDAKVPWVIFGKKSPNDYFGYKFFPSDKCLLISRVEHGQGTAEWLSDPLQTAPSTKATAAELSSTPQGHTVPAVLESGQPAEIHLLEAAWGHDRKIDLQVPGSDSPLNSQDVEKSPIQTGCINPHPGTPTVTVGPTINGCQTPNFRKWADGCSQVQMYDSCHNVWGPIVWQACSKTHHG